MWDHSQYQNKEECTQTIILNIKRDKNTDIQKQKKCERKNMKKNHINFTQPNKWSDSLASLVESPSFATEIATRQWTKNKLWKKNRGLESPP